MIYYIYMTPTPEQLRSPELQPVTPNQVEQARLLLSGTALNPEEKNIDVISANDLQPDPAYTTELLNRASLETRTNYWTQGERAQLNADQKINQWTQSVATTINQYREYYERTEKGQQEASALQRIGINVVGFNQDSARQVYDNFCRGNNVKTYIDQILQAYQGDEAGLQRDINVFQWFGSIFGATEGEIIAQITLARQQAADINRKTQLAQAVSRQSNGRREINNIQPNSPTEKHLKHLWRQRRQNDVIPVIKRIDPNARDWTEELRRLGQQEVQPEEATPLQQRFEMIKGPVNPNHRFYVRTVNDPERMQFSDAELEAHMLIDQHGHGLPFFVDIQQEPDGRVGFSTNRDVVPYVYELGDGNRTNPDIRFMNAEKSTNGDSGLLALAAASAAAPIEQAKLYKILAQNILKLHENDLGFLTQRWFSQGQSQDTNPGQPTSEAIFRIFDHKPGTNNLKPQHQQLLAYDNDGNFNFRRFSNRWRARISELQDALQNDRLESYHLRWLEFLSHSVNIDQMIQTIKGGVIPAGRPAPPPQPPAQNQGAWTRFRQWAANSM